jgi:hypothetical protein
MAISQSTTTHNKQPPELIKVVLPAKAVFMKEKETGRVAEGVFGLRFIDRYLTPKGGQNVQNFPSH